MKYGIHIIPNGLTKTNNTVYLKYDLLLGFPFQEYFESKQIDKEQIQKIREDFQKIITQGNLTLRYIYNDTTTDELSIKLQDESVDKIFDTKAWEEILEKAELDIYIKDGTDKLGKNREAQKAINDESVRVNGLVTTNEYLYNIERDGTVNLDRLEKNSEYVRENVKNLDNRKKRENETKNSLHGTCYTDSGKAYSLQSIYQEIIEHPYYAREVYGLWVPFTIDLSLINGFENVFSLELITNNYQDLDDSILLFEKNISNQNGENETEFKLVDSTQTTIAELKDYSIQYFNIKGGLYYHGHKNYLITQQGSSAYIKSFKSLVHDSEKQKLQLEDRKLRFDYRLDDNSIYARDIDGLFIYHSLSLEKQKSFENDAYASIGQNVICKRKSKDGNLEYFSLCQRYSEVKPKSFFSTKKKFKEEGWIWINTLLEGDINNQPTEYSDPILFAWLGDNLAIPKAVYQTDQNKNNSTSDTSINYHKLMERCGLIHKYTPIPNTNIRLESNYEYEFLIKLVCANGYTLPLKSTKVELGIEDLIDISLSETDTDPFYNAWIEGLNFNSDPEYFSILPPTILGKEDYRKKKKIIPTAYPENNTSMIIGLKPGKNNARRYALPAIDDMFNFSAKGFLQNDKLKPKSQSDYVDKCLSYAGRCLTENNKQRRPYQTNKNGRNSFNTESIEYLSDPRAIFSLLVADDWQTVNRLRTNAIATCIFFNPFNFKASGEFDVFEKAKPLKIRLSDYVNSSEGKQISINTAKQLLIKLTKGLSANFRLHCTHKQLSMTRTRSYKGMIDFLSEHPYSTFKTTHATKQPNAIEYTFPKLFDDTHKQVTLRHDKLELADFYYYELDINPDPSRLQILFREISNHIMHTGEWLDFDTELQLKHKSLLLEYNSRYLANQDFLTHEYDDLYRRDSDHLFDELPPEALSISNKEFEPESEMKLHEEVYRRYFGVKFHFDIDEVGEHLKSGEFVYELSINSHASIILLYRENMIEENTRHYQLILSVLDTENKIDADVWEELDSKAIIAYENIAGSKLINLQKAFNIDPIKFSNLHQLNFEYYWSSDGTKKGNRYITNDKEHKLNLSFHISRIYPTPPTDDSYIKDLCDLIGLPDPKLNADRLSLNPKLTDLYAYQSANGSTQTKFDFITTKDGSGKEPYFIYAKDIYKRHHNKTIELFGFSKYHGMYKDSENKLPYCSQAAEPLQLTLEYNYPVPTPIISATPMFYNSTLNGSDKETRTKEMILLLELDQFYQSGDDQRLGFSLKEKQNGSYNRSIKCCAIGRDAIWSVKATPGEFESYIDGIYTEEEKSNNANNLLAKYFPWNKCIPVSAEINRNDFQKGFIILQAKPHYLKSKAKWVVIIRFKNIDQVASYFTRINCLNYQKHTTQFYPQVSDISIPITIPLFNKREVVYSKTSSGYKLEIKSITKGEYKGFPLSFFIVFLSSVNLESSFFEQQNLFIKSQKSRKAIDKDYHYVDSSEITIKNHDDAEYIYAIEMEAFDNSKIDTLLSKIILGTEDILGNRGLRIINVYQFEL